VSPVNDIANLQPTTTTGGRMSSVATARDITSTVPPLPGSGPTSFQPAAPARGRDSISRMVDAVRSAQPSHAAPPPPVPPAAPQPVPQPIASTEPPPRRTTAARAQVFDASTADAAGYAQLAGTSAHLTGGSDAAIAATNVQRGLDYFASTFGRDGLDGAGAGVDVVINDRSRDASGVEMFAGNGGYYAVPDGQGGLYEAIRFGTGTTYTAAGGVVSQASMLHADDLTVHELTHGLIRKETGHLGGEADESGATNEGVADVLAAAATRDWRIGEGMYTAQSDYRLMRNIADPADPTAVHGLWTHIDEVRARQASGEGAEEHWASGVLSTAAARMQQRIGGEAGWNAVERVYYGAITQGQLGDMSFDTVAAALRRSAILEFGAQSTTYGVVNEELQRGGI
jgi:hypothetical protein